MFERLLDMVTAPSYLDMVQYCGGQGANFEQFNSWIRHTYSAQSEIKFPYGNSYSGCVSFHTGKKFMI